MLSWEAVGPLGGRALLTDDVVLEASFLQLFLLIFLKLWHACVSARPHMLCIYGGQRTIGIVWSQFSPSIFL